MRAKSLQSCLILCDPMNYSPPGSPVHGILPGRILEWVAMPFSRDFPNPGIKLMVFYICIGKQGFFFYH